MSDRTNQASEQNYAQKFAQLFVNFSQNLQADAKRFNEEQKKTKDRLTNGTRLTKHRINL